MWANDPDMARRWEAHTKDKNLPERVAQKTDIAGPELYMTDTKKQKKDRNEMYEDVIYNPEHYRRSGGPVSKSENIAFSQHGQWSLSKGNYGPKGAGLYDPTVNIKRKARNVEQALSAGPNKNAKKYTSNIYGTAAQQADKDARESKLKSKKNPVISTQGMTIPDEIKAQGGKAMATYARDQQAKNPPVSKKCKPRMMKNEHRDATRGYQDNNYRPSQLATDNGGAMKGEANEMNMDNKFKTHGAIMAGGANSAVVKVDRLHGGKGDKLKSSDVDPKQLKMGIKHEMEHTSSKEIAREIALDHLAEDPKYYTKLNTIEKISFSKYGQWSLTKTPKVDRGLDRGQKVKVRRERGKPTQRVNLQSEQRSMLSYPRLQWKYDAAKDVARDRREKEKYSGAWHPKMLP
jgi:hypothetical protein